MTRSERALKQLKSCARTSVVKAIVRASIKFSGSIYWAPRKPDVEYWFGTDGHHETHEGDPLPHLGIDDAISEQSWAPRHHVIGGGSTPHRQSWSRVGEQVDPQDLVARGERRKSPSWTNLVSDPQRAHPPWS